MNMSENTNRNPSGGSGGGEPSTRPMTQEEQQQQDASSPPIGIAAPGAASWHYTPPEKRSASLDGRVASPRPLPEGLDGPNGLNLGSYSRPSVSNLVASPTAQSSPSTDGTTSEGDATSATSSDATTAGDDGDTDMDDGGDSTGDDCEGFLGCPDGTPFPEACTQLSIFDE